MTRELIISLDAMGGDHAPDIVIEGASIARERVPYVRFLIFGDETKIVPLLTRLFQPMKNPVRPFDVVATVAWDRQFSQ